ncbi:tripartite tricarboxylate transporter substrate binding protein [Rhodoplanes sp. TEM]|uniref:Tripartite tricarboxylate transporter substrate binding protein n=1 Tax=Rhodoplanes tepidamans TaxID=200616 RepID=A0ABT5J549_RHOTP|nr:MULTISPECIES: tripartite tricarboxylate transporter substrate binding protein [Rhodoplanes]MDC7784757.1 tripartite tricarboxylate transporter substrate binding protein [Rhodoplanes tepidamans]MDC7982224.1 tripartite tricarboxylate transporter substrate binding protein [Rhodoplanes sp. TEM]MDQ0356231.1 tripartite-type tricarboxylate transporter receptor subunit TctC [Rhodoplanes tepidamans]
MRSILAAALVLVMALPAGAADRLTLVVAHSPGSMIDTVARVLAQKIGERHGTAVLVENRPGAGGIIAGRQVADAPPDGTTLLLNTSAFIVNELSGTISAEELRRLQPIATVTRSPDVLVVGGASGIKGLDALKSLGRPVTYGGATARSAATLFGGHVLKGVPATFVPFNGAPQVIGAVIGGHIDAAMLGLGGGSVPAILNGDLVGIAVADTQRCPLIPDVPTFAELGIPATSQNWIGVFTSSRVDPGAFAKLNALLGEIIADPAVVETLAKQAIYPDHRTVPATREFISAERDRIRSYLD